MPNPAKRRPSRSAHKPAAPVTPLSELPDIEEVQRSRGRPTLYNPHYAKIAGILCGQLGYTDEQLADALEVSVRTVNTWKAVYPDFLQSVKRGKEDIDAKVEATLFQRAIGYSHPDTQFFVYKGKVKSQATVKHYAPDVVAAIFWLKNRKPEQWREKVTHEHKGLTLSQLVAAARSDETQEAPADTTPGRAD